MSRNRYAYPVDLRMPYHVHMFDQNERPKRTRISDDSDAECPSLFPLEREFLPEHLSEPGPGCALTLKVVEGVLERHAMLPEEAVQLVTRRDVQELGELVAGDPRSFGTRESQALPARTATGPVPLRRVTR